MTLSKLVIYCPRCCGNTRHVWVKDGSCTVAQCLDCGYRG